MMSTENLKQKCEDVLRRLKLVLPAYGKGKLAFMKRKKKKDTASQNI